MADNKKKDWYLGIDLGTGSCKSVVIDDRALVLGFGSSDYADIQTPTGWNELDPEELVEGMIRSVREAIDRANVVPQACRAISIGSALHSLIAIDQSGKPSTGLLTWIDARAVDQAAAIRKTEDAHQIYWKTGCPVHTMYPVYKIIWLRQKQPQIFQNASRFVSAKEYVLQRLTGKWLVDYNIAAGSGLLNAHELVWDPDMLRLAGIQSSQLSLPESPGTVIHGLNSTLASRMGLSEDVSWCSVLPMPPIPAWVPVPCYPIAPPAWSVRVAHSELLPPNPSWIRPVAAGVMRSTKITGWSAAQSTTVVLCCPGSVTY